MIFEAYGSHSSTTETTSEVNSTLIESHSLSSSSHSTTESAHEEEEVFNTPFQSIIDAFIMTMGDVGVIYEMLIKVPHHVVIGQVR